MTRPFPLRRFYKEARRGAAAFSVFLFLAVQAAATSPALHALVHSDSNDPSHQCAVTMLLHGKVHTASPTVRVVRSAPCITTEPLFGDGALVSADVCLPSCRGPPSSRLII